MGQHSGATELLNTSAAIACIVVWSLTMDEPYGYGWRDVPKQDLPTLTDATLTNQSNIGGAKGKTQRRDQG